MLNIDEPITQIRARRIGPIDSEDDDPVAATKMVWYSMIHRCTRPSNPAYRNYGGRGIRVCDRWAESLDNFIADMGLRPPNLSIERIDVNGNYEPSNCKWATAKEQMNNTRRSLKNKAH